MVATAQTTLCVDRNAPARAHDGASWCQAYINLQDALAAAVASRDAASEFRDALDADGPILAPPTP